MSEKVKSTEKPEKLKATEKPEQIDFQFKPIKQKPSRRYRKGSKYDPLLKSFIDGTENLVSVNVEGKDANYLRTQLNKLIDSRNLTIKTSVVNDVLYLEKISPEEKKA